MPRTSSRKRKVVLYDTEEANSAESEYKPDGLEPDYQKSNSKTAAQAPEPLVPLSKPKRRRKKVFVINKEEEAKPTYTRKTEKGGYAHTNLSKSRISAANSGNKPWNFGKRRSSADKAKIAAGVRARNRTLLLQKLKRLGMTEEEYNIKKKEIKYLRERIRRAKLANGKRDQRMERKLQDAIDATNVKNVKSDVVVEKEEERPEEEQKEEAKAVKVKAKRTTGIFSKEITWRPFSSSENDFAYDKLCPRGGPGGLICCETCSTKYNMFLTRTSEDVETYRMVKESGEVTEILGFLGQKKTNLKDAVNAAQKKVPPLPPAGSGRLSLRQESHTLSRLNNGNRKPAIHNRSDKTEINHGAWNLTSTMDLGVIGGFASV